MVKPVYVYDETYMYTFGPVMCISPATPDTMTSYPALLA